MTTDTDSSTGVEGATSAAAGAARKRGLDRWMRSLARVGLAARGAVYLVIALLAAQVALGESGEEADSEGAMRAVADQPLGTFLLVVLAVGLLAHALWRVSLVALGRPTQEDSTDRAKHAAADAAVAAVYVGLFVTAASFLFGGEGSSGGDDQEETATAMVLGWPGGRLLVGIAGVVVIGAGVWWFVQRAIQQRFEPPLDDASMSADQHRWVCRLGSVGYTGRSITFVLIGWFLIVAAATTDPDEAEGLDGVLQEVSDAPFGAAALLLVALGLAAYGAFGWCQARWGQVDPTT